MTEFLASVSVVAAPPAASAEAGKQPVAPAPTTEEHLVDFRADRVAIGEDAELELSGDVRIRSERFQLTGDAMTLSRSPRGVHAEGAGRLAFCRCKDPPLTLGFQAADLAPPTDVLLEDATVRVYGVPIFYSPYLWLRSPTRLGVVPPTFAYRGEEGVQLGTGVHIPLSGTGRRTMVDLGASAYLRGGVVLTASVAGEGGHAEISWDHFRGSAWDLTTEFAAVSRTGATLAGRIDALRGARALVAPAAVREVALRMDRARVGVGVARSSVFGVSLIGTAPRGGALGALPAFGPLLELAHRAHLGSHVASSLALETETVTFDDHVVSRSAQRGELVVALPAGPTLNELWVRERVRALTEVAGYHVGAAAEVRGRVALPLARRFRTATHRIEPLIEAAIATETTDRSGRALANESESTAERLTLLGGIETALGDRGSAGDLRVAGGLAGSPDRPAAVAAARARVDASALTLTSEARALPTREAAEVFVRSTAGSSRSIRAVAWVDGRAGNAAEAMSLFYDDFFLAPALPWLARAGWAAGGGLLAPLGLGFRGEASVDFDVTRDRFVGGSATVDYRHSCGCLGVAVWAGKRVGRDAFDMAVRIDLLP